MQYWVYIIKSQTSGILYKGYTSDPDIRINQHNEDTRHFTSGKGPWIYVYLEKMEDKKSALIREKQLKRANLKYINWIIEQDCNILNHK